MFFNKEFLYKGDIISGDKFFSLSSKDDSIKVQLTINDIIADSRFSPYIDNVTITEQIEDIDNIVKDWIVQVKVKTTRNKLYLIEDFLRKEINKILMT